MPHSNGFDITRYMRHICTKIVGHRDAEYDAFLEIDGRG